jgi:hypothetical protein
MNNRPVHRTFSKTSRIPRNQRETRTYFVDSSQRMLRHSDILGEKILFRVFNTRFDPNSGATCCSVKLPTPDAIHSRSIRYYREMGDLCA